MTVSYCCSKSFKTGDMAREFEYSEYSENSENLCRLCNVFQGVLRREESKKERDIEGKNSKEINDVEKSNKKIELNQ